MSEVSESRYQSGAKKGELIKVLLIEDDPFFSRMIQGLVVGSREAIEIEVVDVLADGLTRLAKGQVDLVLLDLSLPDSHGVLTLARVRKRFSNLPIIILTSCDDDEIALQAAQAGAQDYLVKDQLDRNSLLRAVRYAIERQRVEMALREQAELSRTWMGAYCSGTGRLSEFTAGRGKRLSERICIPG
jgi:DNA-binding NarL/FixJ family response regulator